MNLPELFSSIRCFVFDMDGVMTNGNLLLMTDGEWIREMNIRDGYAIQLAVKKGYRVVVMSGSSSGPVEARLRKLGVTEIYMNVRDKQQHLSDYMHNNQLPKETVLFMGDDIPDITALQLAGLGTCPADAAYDVRDIAGYISPFSGGRGCVRDVIEKVLRINNHWNNEERLSSI